MFRNMVTSLLKHERIRTTDAKAKEVRRWADKLVTLAKRGDLHARRQALSIIREKDVVHKLFAEAPQRYAEVNGGYTRVVKVGFRPGDAAPISMVELVTPEVKKKKKRRKKKAKKTAAPAAAATTPDAPETPPAVEAGAATEDAGNASTTTTAVTPDASTADRPEAETKASGDAVKTAPVEEKPAGEASSEPEDDAAADETPPKDA
jgi:large subunit ribosomal protein L17